MRNRNQLNNGLDTSRYEFRISTSNMFAHLEDRLESKRPEIPGPRNQIQNRPKHKSAGKKPEEEVDCKEGEWALVTRKSKKRGSPAEPAKVNVGSTSCSRGNKSKTAHGVPSRGKEEEKEEKDNHTSEPCPGFNIDLDDDFPPLSRAGLPDGMVEKKRRHPAKKSLQPDAPSHSLARGDSVNLKGCRLAKGLSGDQDVEPAPAAGPQATDGETQEDQDGSQSEAEDQAVFQFFNDEILVPSDDPRVIEDLSKMLQRKSSSKGIVIMPRDKKKPRKALQPDAPSHSLARGDSVNLKGCRLAKGLSGDQDVEPAPAAGPQATDGETQEDQDGSQSEAEDQAVFQFFNDEILVPTDDPRVIEDLSKMLQRKSSSKGIVIMPRDKKKPRKALQPDAQNSSLARGDSVNLKGCRLAKGLSGDQDVEPAPAAGPQATDGETQEDQDGSQSEAEDQAVFQFFNDEILVPSDDPRVIEDLSKMLQRKSSSKGIVIMPRDKKKPRKALQPDAQNSSPEAAPSASLGGRRSSQLCAGDETVRPPAAAAQAAEEAEDEDKALGASVEEEYIMVEELQEELSRLLEEKHSSQEIIKWLQANIDDDDVSSNEFLEVLMTCVCQSKVIVCQRELSETRSGPVLQETRRLRALRTGHVLSGDVPHIDAHSMMRWTPLLKVFLQDQEKELTALKALGDLMIRMQHPEGLLQMFLYVLFDEEIIQESTFLKWKDSEEQQGNLELLSSASRFFCWLEGYLSRSPGAANSVCSVATSVQITPRKQSVQTSS